jgi:multidrug efflux pump subunit AcrB
MGPISFFVPVALIVSLFIAIILTPFIAIHILQAEEKEWWLAAYFKAKLASLTKLYIRVLRAIAYQSGVRKKVLFGALGAFLFTLLFPLLSLVHFQMLPKADRDQIYVYVDLPESTAITATKEFAEQVALITLDHAEVTSSELFVAGAPIADFNGLFKGAPNRQLPHQATLRVNFTKAADRSESSTEITNELRVRYKEILGDTADYVRLMEEPPGPPVMATLVAKLTALDTALRQKAATDFASVISDIPGVVDVYTSVEAPVERMVYTLDRDKIAALGLSPQVVTSWFSLTSGPQVVGEFTKHEASEQVPVALSLPYTYTSSPAAAGSVVVRGEVGEAPLSSLADVSYVPREGSLYLEHAMPVEYVTAEIEDRSIVYVVIDIMQGLIGGKWEGYTVDSWSLFGLTLVDEGGNEVMLSWGGEWEMTLENFRDLGVAMMVALFLVYAVLVAQYRSFAVPGFILVTVPLGLVGIFTGFLFLDSLFGIYLTATALIGFIALIGIVVNNAIIYLEYVEQSLAEGVTYTEALIAAGATRLRPILLTSLTTVLGSLTIASDPVWSGLAWAIIFGLSLSTILTLVILPSLLITFSRNRVT